MFRQIFQNFKMSLLPHDVDIHTFSTTQKRFSTPIQFKSICWNLLGAKLSVEASESSCSFLLYVFRLFSPTFCWSCSLQLLVFWATCCICLWQGRCLWLPTRRDDGWYNLGKIAARDIKRLAMAKQTRNHLTRTTIGRNQKGASMYFLKPILWWRSWKLTFPVPCADRTLYRFIILRNKGFNTAGWIIH